MIGWNCSIHVKYDLFWTDLTIKLRNLFANVIIKQRNCAEHSVFCTCNPSKKFRFHIHFLNGLHVQALKIQDVLNSYVYLKNEDIPPTVSGTAGGILVKSSIYILFELLAKILFK